MQQQRLSDYLNIGVKHHKTLEYFHIARWIKGSAIGGNLRFYLQQE